MNAISIEAIEDALSARASDLAFDPTATAYLHNFMSYFLESATQATDLTQWMADNLGETVREQVEERWTVSIQSLFGSLVAIFIDAVTGPVRDRGDTLISPWDLAQLTQGRYSLETVDYEQDFEDEYWPLPVTVHMSDGSSYVHQLTEEATMGLSLWYVAFPTANYSLSMYGVRLEGGLVEGDLLGRYNTDNPDGNNYSLLLDDGAQYMFKTPDFMSGFVTGAAWSGVDPTGYWTEFRTVSNERLAVQTSVREPPVEKL